jgi:phosphoribosylformylglycinamidine cyclo-ligase
VFRVLAEWGSMTLEETEGTWNLGIGMIAVVAASSAEAVIARLTDGGIPAWTIGTVSTTPHDITGFEQGAKGVDGGAVRLVGRYRD